MSRKSNKGFKRLENHELTEFSTLNGGAGDSESEDLLDLSADGGHEQSDSCYSCCCWSTCLYLILLTFMVAVLAIFSSYLMYNVWQINSDMVSAHKSLKESIDNVQLHIDEVRKDTGNKLIVVHRDLTLVNSSVVELHAIARQLKLDIDQLDRRLQVIESQPQETLIQQVASIHHEMSILNRNMDLLNHSLEDVQEMRQRVASVGSIIDSYSAEFNSYQRQIGDITQSNLEIRNDVIAADDKLKQFGDQLSELKSSVTTSHDQIKQSEDLLSAQLTHLQSLVSEVNETLVDEVERVWTNISKVETRLGTMEHELSTVEEKLEQIHSLPVPSGKVPPSSEQPTHSPLTTRHESSSSSGSDRGSDLSVVTTSSDNGAATTTERKEVTSGVSVDAETTTPLPPISEGATESDVFTTATDETNSSLDVNHANNSSGAKNNDTTESDGSVVKEEEEGEGTATTTDGVPPSPGPNDEDEEDEKTKNEKAIAALRIYMDDFELLDRNFDGKLSPSEMGKSNPQIFMLLDSDGDGYITFNELQHMMRVLQSKHDSLTNSEEGVN